MADPHAMGPRSAPTRQPAPSRSERSASVADTGVSIESMRIRVPGRDADAGRRIATAVTEALAFRLPPGLTGRLGDIRLRVEAPRSGSEWATTHAIVDAIVAAISRR